jgi:hypothetical protein
VKTIFFAVLLLSSGAALAQATGSHPLPDKHIPPSVLLELRVLENQFDQALGRDCAPEKCTSKGCAYRDHVVVDLPRASSLPGLPGQEGLGSVPAQEYLTLASCEFAHEKSVSPHDALALEKRLEQRLSKGWLKVTVGHQLLEPISPSLAESPPPKPEKVAPEPPKVEPKLAPEPPKEWDAKVAQRELWVTLLPHFAWIIALLLGVPALLILIWGARRVGRETLEDKAIAAQLAAGSSTAASTKDGTPPLSANEIAAVTAPLEDPFVAEQRQLWRARVDQSELGKDGGGLMQVLRDWLRAREFRLLAKALFVFGDRLSSALPADGELADRKVEFADYLRDLDESTLPGDAEFYRTLHHHSISSALLSQADANTYSSIGAEFGATGVTSLVTRLGGRPGALLFALVLHELQQEVARSLSHATQVEFVAHLLDSTRMSAEERSYLFAAVDAARAGTPLPAKPIVRAQEILDRGHEFDAAGALSVLLPYLAGTERTALLGARASEGVLPQWYEGVLFAEMLARLPSPELKSDLLLEVDVKALAGWISAQPAPARDALLEGLSSTLQNAIRASSTFASRADQRRAARAGHEALVLGLKRLYGRGVTSFAQLAG